MRGATSAERAVRVVVGSVVVGVPAVVAVFWSAGPTDGGRECTGGAHPVACPTFDVAVVVGVIAAAVLVVAVLMLVVVVLDDRLDHG